jgi:plastocyanin
MVRSAMVRNRTVLVVLAVAAASLAAGCGSSSSGGGGSSLSVPPGVSSAVSSAASSAVSSAAGGHVVEIDVVSSGFAFAETTATATAGPVVIRSKNPQTIGHDISLKGNGVDEHGEVVSNGGVSTMHFADLKAGTYTFYCSVPGHEQAGMKGTLTVS